MLSRAKLRNYSHRGVLPSFVLETIGFVATDDKVGLPETALGGRLESPPTVATVLVTTVLAKVDLYCDGVHVAAARSRWRCCATC